MEFSITFKARLEEAFKASSGIDRVMLKLCKKSIESATDISEESDLLDLMGFSKNVIKKIKDLTPVETNKELQNPPKKRKTLNSPTNSSLLDENQDIDNMDWVGSRNQTHSRTPSPDPEMYIDSEWDRLSGNGEAAKCGSPYLPPSPGIATSSTGRSQRKTYKCPYCKKGFGTSMRRNNHMEDALMRGYC